MEMEDGERGWRKAKRTGEKRKQKILAVHL